MSFARLREPDEPIAFTEAERALLEISDRADAYVHRPGRKGVTSTRIGRTRTPLDEQTRQRAAELRTTGAAWATIAKKLRVCDRRLEREMGDQ